MDNAAPEPDEHIVYAARMVLLDWRRHLNDVLVGGTSMSALQHLVGPMRDKGGALCLTPEQRNALRGLAGPHGWAVYKMLLARVEP